MMFKKSVVFSDIHFGLKGNSKLHNEDCIEFTKWAIEEAKAFGSETCIFMGDLHHHRNTMNLETLNYCVRFFELLSENFENSYVLVGNHDMLHRESREYHSFPYAEQFPNVHVIDEITEVENVLLLPWLVKDEHKNLPKKKFDYVFSHLELPGFLVSKGVVLEDHGKSQREDFYDYGIVYSGHFHIRQTLNNVHYIGNCFPHNYGDVFEENSRGIMLLEYGQKHTFKSWKASPRYRTLDLEQFLLKYSAYAGERCYVKTFTDEPITHEDKEYLRKCIKNTLGLREFTIQIDQDPEGHDIEEEDDVHHSIDETVIDHLLNIESKVLDPEILVHLYKEI